MAIRTILKRKSRYRRGSSVIGAAMLSIALIFSALVIRGRSEATTETPRSQIDSKLIRIPVLSEPLEAGRELQTARFELVDYPEDNLTPTVVRDISSIGSAVTVEPVPGGVPIDVRSLSIASNSSNRVIERIPPGMRAMTVRVDATSAVEGWASSGSEVDVLLVTDRQTSVVAERVKVVSTERSLQPLEDGAPNVPSTVTLLVTQEQCLAINTAIPQGKIAFALRSYRDDSKWTNTQYTAEELERGVGSKYRAADDRVQGYVTFSDNEESHRAFALTGDRWIATEIVPEGFLVAEKR